MGKKHCAAINCSNNSKAFPNLHFFRFPKEETRCRRWIINTRREDLLDKTAVYCYGNLTLCEKHFEDVNFMNANTRNRITKQAVPTLFDLPNEPKRLTLKRSLPKKTTQHEDQKRAKKKKVKIEETQSYIHQLKKRPGRKSLYGKSQEVLLLKRALHAKNQALRVLRKKEEKKKKLNGFDPMSIIKGASRYLSPNEISLLSFQLSRYRKRKCNDDFKMLALSLKFKSSSCYKELHKQLKFPNPRTLDRWTSHYIVNDGFDDAMLKNLEQKVQSIPVENRVCVLLMDEMSIKQNAQYNRHSDQIIGICNENGKLIFTNTATVFMISGLRSKWRHGVGYFMTENGLKGGTIKDNLIKCIGLMQKIGLRILAITADQGSNFCKALAQLGISIKRPFFMVNNEKVFVLHDPPHLWKSTRNCLINNDILTSDGLVSWKHFENLFQIESSKSLRMCPKLREAHINLPKFGGKMKVNLATQLLSHSVSTALNSLISMKELPESAQPTSIFCAKFNKIVDIMNSSQKSGATPFKSALELNSDSFYEIDTALEWIKGWKIINSDGKCVNDKFRFVDGLLLSLTSMKEILLHLIEERNWKYLLTRRLCQDPLEHFFGAIRQRGGFCKNPTSIAFKQAFRMVNLN